MQWPRMARYLIILVATSTPAFAWPRALANADDGEEAPTVESLIGRVVAAAGDVRAKDSLLYFAASTLARSGHVDEALRLADGDRGEGAKESILRATALAQARSGDFVGALRSAHRLEPDKSRQLILLIPAQQAWAGDLAGARRMVEAELGEPESGFALLHIAQALEDQGNFAESARLFEAIPSLRLKAQACRATAKARLKDGDIPGALRAAEDSRRLTIEYLAQPPPERGRDTWYSEIKPDTVRDGILGTIAEEQARRGDVSGARKTTEAITGGYRRVLTAAETASILARAGDKTSAKIFIKWAFEQAELDGHQGFELMEIAAAETLAGETEAARKTFLRALGTVGPAVLNQSNVPAAQARAGDLDGAMQTIGAIIDRGAKDRALRYIARTAAKAGNGRKAVEIAGGILSAKERVLALREVSEAQESAGDRVGALTTIRLAAAIIDPPDADTLWP